MRIGLKDYSSVIEMISDGVYYVDKERQIKYWNSAAEEITGYSADEVVESFCHENILQHIDEDGTELCVGYCPLLKSMDIKETVRKNVFLHHKKGYRVPIEVTVIPVDDDNGEIIGAIEIFKELSSKKDQVNREKELKKISMYDPLTSLANAKYINKMIEFKIHELNKIDRDFALLKIGIDNLKKINDDYGNDTGDIVLKTVAQTLKLNIRTGDIVGRWRDDEFIALLLLDDINELKKMSEKLRVLVDKTINYSKGKEILTTVSIGATLITKDDDANRVVYRADSLMLASKEKGKNTVTTD